MAACQFFLFCVSSFEFELLCYGMWWVCFDGVEEWYLFSECSGRRRAWGRGGCGRRRSMVSSILIRHKHRSRSFQRLKPLCIEPLAALRVLLNLVEGLQERIAALRRTGLSSGVTRGRKTLYDFGPHPRPKAIPFGLAPICLGYGTGTEYKK